MIFVIFKTQIASSGIVTKTNTKNRYCALPSYLLTHLICRVLYPSSVGNTFIVLVNVKKVWKKRKYRFFNNEQYL